jgi:hypothetical protein
VLLAVHAQQVLAHGEGLAQQVGDDAIARDVRHLFAQSGVRNFGEQRDERCASKKKNTTSV